MDERERVNQPKILHNEKEDIDIMEAKASEKARRKWHGEVASE